MTIRHHPSDELIAGYATGKLGLASRLVVASHVEHCEACQRFVRGIELAAGVMLEDTAPATMAPDALTRTLARIDTLPGQPPAKQGSMRTNEPGLPACLRSYELGKWRWLGPAVRMRPVLLDEPGATRLFLLKGSPGTRLPQHSHRGTELTSILAGSYIHEGGRFDAGDFEEADEEIEHRPVVGLDEECLCLVALDGRLRLSGWVGVLLDPFVGL
jgi:putative transcriptional regulator